GGRLVQLAVVVVEPAVQKVVVGSDDVALQATLRSQLITDGRTAVRQHATEGRAGAAVTNDGAQKANVLTDGCKRAARVEQHEAVLEHDPELFEQLDGATIGVDRDLLVQNLQALIGPRLEAHVDQVQPGITQCCEQLGLDVLGPAADLPDHTADHIERVELVNELEHPALPGATPEREVVVLEQEDPRAALVMQLAHLRDHALGTTDAYDLPGCLPIERVDRAERAAPRTAATGQEREGAETEYFFGITGSVRERQLVEIMHEGSRRALHHGSP